VKPWTWVALASGPLAVGLWWVAGSAPAVVEAVYSRVVYPALMAPWSRLWGAIPFPVFPVLALVALVGLGLLFVFLPWTRALALVAASASVLVAWFVLAWGLNYQRLSWAETQGWTVRGGTVHDLAALATRLVHETNIRRERIEAPFDGGTAELRSAVSRAWENAGKTNPLLAGRYSDPKAVGTDAMSWLGLAGICLPFTGEPLVNGGPRDWQLPFAAAHEAAHLRGWAREDEANFLAFWVLRDAEPRLAYSAWSSALLYVASALEAAGPLGREAWATLAPTLSPQVRADWQASFAYWDRFRGPVAQAAQAVNDVYLKTQGQSDGVKSYGRMVDLLLASERFFAPEAR